MKKSVIIPAIIAYSGQVAAAAQQKRGFLPDLNLLCEEKLVRQLNLLLEGIAAKTAGGELRLFNASVLPEG